MGTDQTVVAGAGHDQAAGGSRGVLSYQASHQRFNGDGVDLTPACVPSDERVGGKGASEDNRLLLMDRYQRRLTSELTGAL